MKGILPSGCCVEAKSQQHASQKACIGGLLILHALALFSDIQIPLCKHETLMVWILLLLQSENAAAIRGGRNGEIDRLFGIPNTYQVSDKSSTY